MKNKFTMMEGGHFKKEGYWYSISCYVPEFSRKKTITLHKDTYKTVRISFPTILELTTKDIYVSIKLVLFGFGISLEIQSE